MRIIVRGVVVGVLLLVPLACGDATLTPTATPSPAATSAASDTPVAVAQTSTQTTPMASATLTPSAIPSATATATLDPTRSAGMTLDAIRVAVTASGVPEGSTAFEAQVAATRCALIPPPTSTPLPWRLAPEQPYLVSANCLGNDLPGQDVRVWQDGAWIEGKRFNFADPAALVDPRQAFLAYLGLISFKSSPPGRDFESLLAQRMNSEGVLPSPDSCLAADIASQVSRLLQGGNYVRLTFTQPVNWDSGYYLYVSPVDIQLALPWTTGSVRQELIAMDTGTLVRQATLPGLAGTARLSFDTAQYRWILVDDDGGYYCHFLPFFMS